jgi:hypothetical protein
MKILFLIISLFFISDFANAKKNNDEYIALTPENVKNYSKKIKENVKILTNVRPKIRFSNHDIDIEYCLNLAVNLRNNGNLKMCHELLKELLDKTIIQS